MAFYTRLRVGMRSEVTGGGLGDSFSEEAARTNSGDPTRFLHWTSMQGQPRIFSASVGARLAREER
ncbi:hypothetical protein EMIT0P44_230076 [Pseudomonas sp. IT-P44]